VGRQKEARGGGAGSPAAAAAGEDALSLPQRQQLALLVRANPALLEAVVLLQPVPLPLMAALAERAGMRVGAAALQRELQALGLTLRAEG